MFRSPYCQYGAEDADRKVDHGMGLAMERRKWEAVPNTIVRNAILESGSENRRSIEGQEEILR